MAEPGGHVSARLGLPVGTPSGPTVPACRVPFSSVMYEVGPQRGLSSATFITRTKLATHLVIHNDHCKVLRVPPWGEALIKRSRSRRLCLVPMLQLCHPRYLSLAHSVCCPSELKTNHRLAVMRHGRDSNSFYTVSSQCFTNEAALQFYS